MADNLQSTQRSPPQEKNGFLRVTPARDKPQSSGSQVPMKTIKRPFGGGETTGEPLMKRSRTDQNGDRNHPQERKPRTLDAAMLNDKLGPADQKTLEEVKARIASATPSKPSGEYITHRSSRHTESVKPVVTTKPTAPKSLRDAPPLPSDTEPDRDSPEDSGYDRRDHMRTGPCSVAGGFMDDRRSSFSPLIEHQERIDRLDPGRNKPMPESRNRRRSTSSDERLPGKRMRGKERHEQGQHRARSRERAMRHHDRTNSCHIRSRSRSRSLSREQNDDRYRGDYASKPERHSPRRRDEILPDLEEDNHHAAPRYHPSRTQLPRGSTPPLRLQGRQSRAISPREQMRERLAGSRSRETSQTPEQDHTHVEPWSQFESADPPPDPHESLGVNPGEYTEEQELSLFGILISIYTNREKIAELTLNQKRLQYELDNRRTALRKRRSREQRDDL